jgi:hypothetical protein
MQILRKLTIQEFYTMRSTCKIIYGICDNEVLWMNFCKKLIPFSTKQKVTSFKQHLVDSYIKAYTVVSVPDWGDDWLRSEQPKE